MQNDIEVCSYLDKDVVNLIKLFRDDKKVLNDYKLIGNKFGATLVLHFIKPPSEHHDMPATPSSKKSSAAIRILLALTTFKP